MTETDPDAFFGTPDGLAGPPAPAAAAPDTSGAAPDDFFGDAKLSGPQVNAITGKTPLDRYLAGEYRKSATDPGWEDYVKDQQHDSAGITPGGLWMGFRRSLLDAPAQMLARGAEAAAPSLFKGAGQDVDTASKAAETAYREYVGKDFTSDPGAALGGAVPKIAAGFAMPGAYATGLGYRMLAGGLTGATTAMMDPVDTDKDPNFWAQKGVQAGTGAVTGALTPLAFRGAERMVSPELSDNLRTLQAAGVNPTPGQFMGGGFNRAEEGATSIPIVGDVIKSARAGAVNEFNRGGYNRALGHIGQELDPATEMGHDAVAETQRRIGAAYDAALPQITGHANMPFLQNMTTLRQLAQNLHPDYRDQFETVFQNDVMRHFSPNGTISGTAWKEADSTLGQAAKGYMGSSLEAERQLGRAILQMKTNLRTMMYDTNPPHLMQGVANADAAWGDFKRLQVAAARQGSDEGTFTPAQLSSAVREGDPSLDHGAFARGEARMQDYSGAGKSVLANKVPDSGTPFRMANAMALPALAGLAYTNPVAAAGVTGGAAIASGLYSPWGRAALAHAMMTRPAAAPLVAGAMRSATPAVSALTPGAHPLAESLLGMMR